MKYKDEHMGCLKKNYGREKHIYWKYKRLKIFDPALKSLKKTLTCPIGHWEFWIGDSPDESWRIETLFLRTFVKDLLPLLE